ncbi:MAG: cation:proton antiporter [Rhodanobacteraceae bacterium]|nr:cation:proton antiporter [Rhodanobacteraceae bacterium]
MNPASIEALLSIVLVQWVLIILAARLGGWLAVRMGQPPAVGEICAGLALGPSVLGLIWPEAFALLFPKEGADLLRFLGKLGLILFLFHVGLNFDFSHLKGRSRSVLAVAAVGIALPFALGLAVSPWLHAQFAPDASLAGLAFFVAIAMSISALPIMGRILMELGLERSLIGMTALSAAAIDDLIGWIGLAAIAALVGAGMVGFKPLLQIAGLALLALVLLKVARPLHARVLQRHAALSPGHLLFLAPTLLLSCLATYYLGVFAIFGAFALGVALHGQGNLEQRWDERYADPVRLLLVPVFFTYTGLNTRIGEFDSTLAWVACGAVILLSVLGKFGGCYLAGRWSGLAHREAGAVASLMNTRALMGLIAVSLGLELGVLNGQLYTMFVLMCLVTTAMAAPLLRSFLGGQAVHWASVDGVRALAAR